eukprot:TRINITY_DN278_c1_g1_i1.p1 TRINITY_DN278_c1_g1~~TRINITY_DN278_c1_g1_i1.p1  ORF type:complete len:226 (-),score=83.83 TRINITY_DN278_c1_g1_i1:62-718(-)
MAAALFPTSVDDFADGAALAPLPGGLLLAPPPFQSVMDTPLEPSSDYIAKLEKKLSQIKARGPRTAATAAEEEAEIARRTGESDRVHFGTLDAEARSDVTSAKPLLRPEDEPRPDVEALAHGTPVPAPVPAAAAVTAVPVDRHEVVPGDSSSDEGSSSSDSDSDSDSDSSRGGEGGEQEAAHASGNDTDQPEEPFGEALHSDDEQGPSGVAAFPCDDQ